MPLITATRNISMFSLPTLKAPTWDLSWNKMERLLLDTFLKPRMRNIVQSMNQTQVVCVKVHHLHHKPLHRITAEDTDIPRYSFTVYKAWRRTFNNLLTQVGTFHTGTTTQQSSYVQHYTNGTRCPVQHSNIHCAKSKYQHNGKAWVQKNYLRDIGI